MTQTVYVPVDKDDYIFIENELSVPAISSGGMVSQHFTFDLKNLNGYKILSKQEAILLTPEEAEKIKFVLDILTQPVFQKDYPEYSKLATESLKIFNK